MTTLATISSTPCEFTPEFLARFHAKVDKRGPNECWEWTASLGTNGYGQIRVAGRTRPASRIAFGIEHGWLPPIVRHSCDNPPCCNPAHLLPGTQVENGRDASDRGRLRPGHVPGSKSGKSKINEEVAAEIIRRVSRGDLQRDVARSLGISFGIVNYVCKGGWAHVPREAPLRTGTVRGERHGGAKLTDEQVAEIRRLRASGVSARELSDRFSVSTSHVNRIIKGESRAYRAGGGRFRVNVWVAPFRGGR